MSFQPGFTPPPTIDTDAFWFVFEESRLLIGFRDEKPFIPSTADLDGHHKFFIRQQYLGILNGRDCYTVDTKKAIPLSDGYVFKDLRAMFGSMEEEMIWTAGRANQLAVWNRTHQYCGHCGSSFENKSDERAKICPQCGLINYPRLSPAVIMAVIRDDRILLGRNKRFRLPFYSVLAGFVEPGETLEACVSREIKEEVGIEVKNVRYFGSQPWPFPDSLMIAFIADYAAGEIRVDRTEITEADWFSAADLPKIPPRISIARQLIDWFLEGADPNEVQRLKTEG